MRESDQSRKRVSPPLPGQNREIAGAPLSPVWGDVVGWEWKGTHKKSPGAWVSYGNLSKVGPTEKHAGPRQEPDLLKFIWVCIS